MASPWSVPSWERSGEDEEEGRRRRRRGGEGGARPIGEGRKTLKVNDRDDCGGRFEHVEL